MAEGRRPSALEAAPRSSRTAGLGTAASSRGWARRRVGRRWQGGAFRQGFPRVLTHNARSKRTSSGRIWLKEARPPSIEGR